MEVKITLYFSLFTAMTNCHVINDLQFEQRTVSRINLLAGTRSRRLFNFSQAEERQKLCLYAQLEVQLPYLDHKNVPEWYEIEPDPQLEPFKYGLTCASLPTIYVLQEAYSSNLLLVSLESKVVDEFVIDPSIYTAEAVSFSEELEGEQPFSHLSIEDCRHLCDRARHHVRVYFIDRKIVGVQKYTFSWKEGIMEIDPAIPCPTLPPLYLRLRKSDVEANEVNLILRRSFIDDYEFEVEKDRLKSVPKAKEEGTQLAKEEGTQLAKEEGTQLAKEEGIRLAKKEGTQLATEEVTQLAKEKVTQLAIEENTQLAKKEGTQLESRLSTLTSKERSNLCTIARKYYYPAADVLFDDDENVAQAQTYSFQYSGVRSEEDVAILCPTLPNLYLRMVDVDGDDASKKSKITLNLLDTLVDRYYNVEIIDYVYAGSPVGSKKPESNLAILIIFDFLQQKKAQLAQQCRQGGKRKSWNEKSKTEHLFNLMTKEEHWSLCMGAQSHLLDKRAVTFTFATKTLVFVDHKMILAAKYVGNPTLENFKKKDQLDADVLIRCSEWPEVYIRIRKIDSEMEIDILLSEHYLVKF